MSPLLLTGIEVIGDLVITRYAVKPFQQYLTHDQWNMYKLSIFSLQFLVVQNSNHGN